MPSLRVFLRLIAPIPIAVGLLHVILGLDADRLLGAGVPSYSVVEPALDSQNRFYGAAFIIYGILPFVCAGDLARYAPVLRWTLWVLFVGGLARVISLILRGVPPLLVLVLMLVELVVPPVLLVWLSRTRESRRDGQG